MTENTALKAADHTKCSPLVLFASRRVFSIFSFACLSLLLSSLLIKNSNPIMCGIMIFAFSLPFGFFGFHLISNGYRLDLTDGGLALTCFERTQTARWADVKSIRAGSSGFYKQLFVNYRERALDRSLTLWPVFFVLAHVNWLL
ncbi:hypothetical protein [Nitrobacter sp.]|uniref:hypothetical protein n=1 Tax=Nitrobacter sp. TaxID=29420 RepID=UPI003F64B5EB